jgi:hypothetical protein
MMLPFQIPSANRRTGYLPRFNLLGRSSNLSIDVSLGSISPVMRGPQKPIDFEHCVLDRAQHRQAALLLPRTARPLWCKELMTFACETLRPNSVSR